MTLPQELKNFTGALIALRSTNTALSSQIARGIFGSTEHYGYKYTAPVLKSLGSATQKVAATRALALLAKYRRVSHSETVRFGQAAASATSWSDSTARKLALLVDLDLEQAVQVFDALLAQIEESKESLNWFDLVDTLVWWDSGDPERDFALRSRLVYDFHSHAQSPKNQSVR